jgi:hypothetical protein
VEVASYMELYGPPTYWLEKIMVSAAMVAWEIVSIAEWIVGKRAGIRPQRAGPP